MNKRILWFRGRKAAWSIHVKKKSDAVSKVSRFMWTGPEPFSLLAFSFCPQRCCLRAPLIYIRGELLPQFSIFLSPDFLFLHVLEFTTMYHTSLRQDVFMKEEYHYLNVSKVGTFTVYHSLDCTFECLGNPSCLSFNLAAYKGADGKLRCELLSSEKYSNPEEYKRNESFHHFSIKVW